MPADMMNLPDCVDMTPDADLMRQMIGFAAERLIELEGCVRLAGALPPARNDDMASSPPAASRWKPSRQWAMIPPLACPPWHPDQRGGRRTSQ